MMMNQYLIRKDNKGNEYIVLNPKWKEQVDEIRYKYFLELSDIPVFYHNIEFKDYAGDQSSEAFKKILYYAENLKDEKFNHVNLFLFGVASSQKTASACNVLKSAIHQGLRAKFILAGTLINYFLKCQGYSHDAEAYQYLKDLKLYDIICIDDIFDSQKSILWNKPDSRNLIISEIDLFLRDMLVSDTKLILTSNYGIENIKQNYGDYVFELVDRNFISIQLFHSVKNIRKQSLSEVFKDIN
jgi:DNA replication protein DnaC